jgi:hypothetical protein
MAIRIRKIDNTTIALCAAETDYKDGDLYLDDNIHYALAAKFCQDWQNQKIDWQYPHQWELMNTQKLRDAETELKKWIAENSN